MFKKIAVAATLAVLATSAVAVERGHVYAGADFGTTKTDDLSGRSSSFGSFVGYQITPMFAVEANVRRLIDTRESNVDVNVRQLGLSLVATYPMTDDLTVFGRVGYNRLKITTSVDAAETENKPLYGIGVGFAIAPNIAGRVEFQKPRSDTNNIGASVVFQF